MLPILFCPQCQAYVGPSTLNCICGWERSSLERNPEPSQPLWSAQVGEAVNQAVISGDVVIFGYGQRNGRGGVAAFDARSGEERWSFETEHAVVGGITVEGDGLYFGTLGFLGSGAELFCLRREDGSQVWKRELPGGVWSAPLVNEARVYVGTDDGQVMCFDRRNGEPVSHRSVSLPKDRNWLVRAGDLLLALSQEGEVMALTPFPLRKHWTQPVETLGKITSPPCLGDGAVFFGGEGGKVLRLKIRKKRLQTLADGLKAVIARPTLANDTLYVGEHNHYLRALDPQTGQEIWRSVQFEHSISSAPSVFDGCVVVCVNGVGVYLLDANTGQEVWFFPINGERGLFSDPVYADGVIYLGADNGRVFALPWHLGHYKWAAQKQEALERYKEAGTYYALAGWGATYQERQNFLEREGQTYFERASQAWLQSQHPEWAAYFTERDVSMPIKEVAQLYEEAGKVLRYRNPALASNLLLAACDWYEEINEARAYQRCQRMTSRLSRGPHIHIKGLTVPRIWQEDNYFLAVFELKNRGHKTARQLKARFAGDVKTRVWVEIQDMSPGACAEVEVPLMAHSPGTLTVETRFQNDQGTELRTTRRFAIQEVKPFEGVVFEGDVAWLSLEDLSPEDLPGKVIVKGDVGVAKVKFDESRPIKT